MDNVNMPPKKHFSGWALTFLIIAVCVLLTVLIYITTGLFIFIFLFLPPVIVIGRRSSKKKAQYQRIK